jgi:hypothetical protein
MQATDKQVMLGKGVEVLKQLSQQNFQAKQQRGAQNRQQDQRITDVLSNQQKQTLNPTKGE